MAGNVYICPTDDGTYYFGPNRIFTDKPGSKPVENVTHELVNGLDVWNADKLRFVRIDKDVILAAAGQALGKLICNLNE
jgi:hypothetical protein